MNKRIRELAIQADIWCDQNYPNNEFYDIRWEEKFAELIVRECINEIHIADVGDLKGKSYYLDKVAEHIEQHFGVEE